MTETPSAADPTVRELQLPAGGDLELRLGSNRLRVRATDGDRVVIRGRTDHDLERDFEITAGTGWVRVTDGPAGSFRVGPITVRNGGLNPDLDVDVPRNVRISARTLSGDIDAIGIIAPSRWQSASGNIRLGAEGGPVTIETMSGDALVDARGPLSVTARTVSGAVRVRAPQITVLDVATTSGDITVEALLDAGAVHSVTSVSGDLRLSTGSEVTVALQSVAGDIRAALPHRVDGARGRRTVVVGSGRVRVEVKTMSGNVKLMAGAPDSAPAGQATSAGWTARQNAGMAADASRPTSSFWAEFGRDWAESAKDWASWATSWAAGKAWASPGASPAATATEPPEPASVPVAPAPVVPSPSAHEPSLDDTTPVPPPATADIEAARIEVLRSLERGELDVEAAADRLAALDAAGRQPEA